MAQLRKIAEALDKGLKVTADIRASRQFKDGRTKLNQQEYKDIAKDIKKATPKGESWFPRVKAALGILYWDSNGNAVKNPATGRPFILKSGTGDTIIPVDAEKHYKNKANQAARRKAKMSFTDKDIEAWAEELERTGKMPKGKSLKDFLKKEKALDTRQKNLVKESNTKAGYQRFEDGHALSLGNEQQVNTPLRKKGMYGSHSGAARAVEPKGENNPKQHRGDIDYREYKHGGVPTDRADRFMQYLLGDRGTLAKPTKGDTLRMMQKENVDKVIAQRDKANQIFKQIAASRALDTNVDTTKSFNLSDTFKIGRDSTQHNPFGMPIYKP